MCVVLARKYCLLAGVALLALEGCHKDQTPSKEAVQPASQSRQSPGLSETQKIEAMINAVDQLQDATFIRNGSPYNCHAAASHMRRKWNWQKDQIKTAEDFIRLAASTSSESGQPYLIRFKDGREMTSAQYLSTALKAMESPANAL